MHYNIGREDITMTENLILNQENVNDKNYTACLAAEAVVMEILGHINDVRGGTKTTKEADKFILDVWAPELHKALNKSRQAFDTWLDGLRASEGLR